MEKFVAAGMSYLAFDAAGCLTVMMPSSSVLVSLFPFDVPNPFEVDAFLRHTTIFGHVFHNQVISSS